MKYLRRFFKRRCLFLFCVIFLLCLTSGTVFAERLAVSVPTANIRSGPGSEYKVLWQVEKYHPLLILKKDGNWYQFQDFEKDVGWIHNSLLCDQEAAITIKDNCNVRSGSGTGYQVRFSAEKGIPFKVLKRKGVWIHVQHADGEIGWIHKSLIW